MFVENYRTENSASMMLGGEANRVPYARISPEDWRVWTTFLPVCAQTMDTSAGWTISHRFLYVSEGVPFDVVSEIRKASVYFDEIEIWRTYRIEKDPIAVGVLNDDRYMIARWGLEELIPFEKIKKKMALILLWKYATQPLGLMVSAAAVAYLLVGISALMGTWIH